MQVVQGKEQHMAIHTNINIIFGTDAEKTGKFMEILAPEGYDLTLCGSNEIFSENNDPRLIILCETGFDLIEQIRRRSSVPILYAADCADELTVIMGLSKGADAVVDKGIPPMEFAARVKALLRRAAILRRAELEENKEQICAGGICLDDISRTVTADGSAVHTTNIEFGILRYLMTHPGKICSVEEIYSEVWNSSSYDVRKTVVEHIRRLRRKIEKDPKNPLYIKAVFGAGYTFSAEASARQTA